MCINKNIYDSVKHKIINPIIFHFLSIFIEIARSTGLLNLCIRNPHNFTTYKKRRKIIQVLFGLFYAAKRISFLITCLRNFLFDVFINLALYRKAWASIFSSNLSYIFFPLKAFYFHKQNKL